jgi:hypothetical protein
MNRKPSRFPLHALLALALAACFGGEKPARVAGGDDYPNGVEPLGKKSAAARSDSADWNGFDSLPKSAPGLYDTVQVPDSVPDTAGAGKAPPPPSYAGKRSAADTLPIGGLGEPLDTLVARVIDTAKGTVEAVRTQVSDGGTKQVDSTLFVPADPAKPGSVAGVNQVVRRIISPDSSQVDLWTFADADGDGLLTPRAGSANLARVEWRSAAGGAVVVRTRVISAGADLDFNQRADNRLLKAAVATVIGGDTVSIVTLLDADGDSAVFDVAKAVNLVDFLEVRTSAAGPIAQVTRKVRIAAHPDSARNFPIGYGERRAFRDGSVLDLSARGLAADSVFRAGGEARWTETRFGAPADSVERASRAFAVRLGSVPGDFKAALLLGFTVEQSYRGGVRSFAFDFRCDPPVADGRWVATGDVIASWVREDGERLVFAGEATASGLAGRLTGPDSSSASIRFGLDGSISK